MDASSADALAQARDWITAAARIVVLTGAGVSAESGVPTFRDAQTGLWARFRPEELATEEAFRRHPQRVWDWYAERRQTLGAVRPNAGHEALARFAGRHPGRLVVATQNVDGLHQAAGSEVVVVELHGSLAQVVCLRCGRKERRDSLQMRLEGLNPDLVRTGVEILPDGDADVPDSLVQGFTVPSCLHCGGVLKADVVFFGENVPRARVERAFQLLDEADSVLVLGSSLAVRSGYRFVVAAKEAGKGVAIVNRGPTRGDADADVRVEGRLGEVLPELARRLAG